MDQDLISLPLVGAILASCFGIQTLIGNRTRREFGQDRAAVREVRRHLKNIRKAARRIPDSYKSAHPEVEWRRLSAIRIVFFYEYSASTWTRSGTSSSRPYRRLGRI